MIEEQFDISFQEKAKALWETVLDCKVGKATKEGYVNASGLVSAISELNKMQGHYKKEKDIEQDIDEMKDTLKKLVELNKKEY